MAEHPLFLAFQQFIHKNHLIQRGDKILVSVSGGVDSIVLLNLMRELLKYLDFEIAVVHFNHRLRGIESDEDEKFVRSISKKLVIECHVGTADTRGVMEKSKLSLQETARKLRYEFFAKMRLEFGYTKIATAHNADDNAETILLNLFRGTGIHGMTGIPIFRKDQSIIRPLIFATRESIKAYSITKGIEYREDSSNLKSDYTRNFIRHKILPPIRDNINSNLTLSLERTSQLFNQLEEYLDNESKKIINLVIEHRSQDELIINNKLLNEKHIYLVQHILLMLGREFSGVEINFNTIESMINILLSETGAYCHLSKDVVLYHDRDRIVFKRIPSTTQHSHTIELDKIFRCDAFEFSASEVPDAKLTDDPNIEFIDGDKLGLKLSLRPWQHGDWFVPFGMKDKKKISDFFIDKKIPLFDKESIPIFISDDQVVWICGKRLDERFRITDHTKRIVKLEYTKRIKTVP